MEDANWGHALRSLDGSCLIPGKIETKEILKGLTLFKLVFPGCRFVVYARTGTSFSGKRKAGLGLLAR